MHSVRIARQNLDEQVTLIKTMNSWTVTLPLLSASMPRHGPSVNHPQQLAIDVQPRGRYFGHICLILRTPTLSSSHRS